MSDFTTPMMKQYMKIKKQYPDCLLFFRLGDFYELFLEDARIAAQILDITLTSRNKGKDGRIPMAGVPYHAVDSYLAKLVKAGFKIAICEQIGTPNKYGLVDREVVRVVTPGTLLDEKNLAKKENNYIISLIIDRNNVGLAFSDISTGEFYINELTSQDNLDNHLADELTRINPAECILPENLYNQPQLLKIIKSVKNINITRFSEFEEFAANAVSYLEDHFGVKSLAAFGVENKSYALQAAAALLGYLKYTQKSKIKHIEKIKTHVSDKYLILDRSTIANLELFTTLKDNEHQGSLISHLDNTITAMGGRKLRQWLIKPSRRQQEISERHDLVSELLNKPDYRFQLTKALKKITDIERILSRLSTGLANGRDLVNLKLSLKHALIIGKIMANFTSKLSKQIHQNIDTKLSDLIDIIDKHIVDNPPVDVKQGGLIKEGVNEELDKLKEVLNQGENWLRNFARKERARTGINSLKVKSNQVFGYYLEVSKPNLHLVPKDYIRKQTLTNAERFITVELKQYEEQILSASQRITELEYQLFLELVNKALSYTSQIKKAANSIAILDCLLNFAYLAEKYDYTRPFITTDGTISIKAGRHPVLENLTEDPFVPNDVTLNHEDKQLLIITGPNMAGKSVFIRQVALITLMAQMGSFVPAEKAVISLTDRIMVRSGAADSITKGLSTFMMEMVETANILHYATSQSLVILDEVGRGTSTYDGVSIAWAIAEYLVSRPKKAPLTLFATHYHELQALEKLYSGIKNYQLAVKEEKEGPIFLHKVIPGGAAHSYGIAVAKMAGIPKDIIYRAAQILKKLEDKEVNAPKSKIAITPEEQLTFLKEQKHPVLEELKKIDPNQLTPLQALEKLAALKAKI